MTNELKKLLAAIGQIDNVADDIRIMRIDENVKDMVYGSLKAAIFILENEINNIKFYS